MRESIMAEAGAGLRARVVLIGERLDIRGLARADSAIADPVPITSDAGRHAFAFRWGAVAMIGFSPDSEGVLLRTLSVRVADPLPHPVDEQAILVPGAEQDGVDQEGVIRLRDLSLPRLGIVADALAKSAALSHQEEMLASTLDRMEPAIALVRDRGRIAFSSRLLLRTIGAAISARNRAAARVQPEDKPDLLWEHPELERLHLRLVDEFELRERSAALDRKLTPIGETVQTLLSLVEARRSLGLEVAVTTLVAIEVASTVYGLVMP